MTLMARRLLAFCFALAFLTVAPLAILYGRGYRYNLSSGRVTLTGVIALFGQRKTVTIQLDNQPARMLTAPQTLRSILPGSHTLTVSAGTYIPQTFTVHVYPGQTSFIQELQLFRDDPWRTVATGLPGTAQLSPTGTAVAWLSASSVYVRTPTQTLHTAPIPKAASAAWNPNGLSIRVKDSTGTVLTDVNLNATTIAPAKDVRTGDATTVQQLARAAAIQYQSYQPLHDGSGWLLLDTNTATILGRDGTTTTASRWFLPVLGVVDLGSSTLATVRDTTVTLRNIVNNQLQDYPVVGATGVAADTEPGVLNLLVQDGDLLSWSQAVFF